MIVLVTTAMLAVVDRDLDDLDNHDDDDDVFDDHDHDGDDADDDDDDDADDADADDADACRKEVGGWSKSHSFLRHAVSAS